MKKHISKLLISCYCFTLFLLSGCNHEKPKENPYKNAELSAKIFSNDSIPNSSLHGFGYDIYMYKSTSPYIHQPNIPGIPGNSGFTTKENAEKTAHFIIYKIHNNIMPPSINAGELDSLGVLK